MAKKYIVSLKDIAEETGVSISTVSRVIKKKGRLSHSTRDKVMTAAKKLKYQSNLLIDGMKTGKSRTVGVCTSVIDPYQNLIIAGINDALGRHKYAMMLSSPPKGMCTELEHVHLLMQHRVEGVIICPLKDNAENEYFHEVIDSGIPLVTIDRDLPNALVNYVGTEDFEGARLATAYLIDKGHRVIGHIKGQQYTSTGRLRQEGFSALTAESPGISGIVSDFELFTDEEHDLIEKFIFDNPEMTAIFASNDNVAIAVYKVLTKLGKRIPDDVSVIAFSDVYAHSMIPELTAIEQKPYDIGVKAVERIFAILNNDSSSPEKIRMMPQMVERDSVKVLK
jgi:LacI family transcriptional regulator, galactose operon repressor